MNKKTSKGEVNNVDTPQMAQMRQLVVEQELSARSWKAYYDKMYFSLESEKLEQPYKEYQERVRVRLEKEKELEEKVRKSLAEISDNNGEVKLEVQTEQNV